MVSGSVLKLGLVRLGQAIPLGEWLASIGVHLLTGGGKGVMESVSKAFYESPARQGVVLGVIPGLNRGGTCSQPATHKSAVGL
jgi:predicted Rossmann-fold nucleotide-binding protein